MKIKIYLETSEERIGVYCISDIEQYDEENDEFETLDNANDFIGEEDFFGDDIGDVQKAVAESVAEQLGIDIGDVCFEDE